MTFHQYPKIATFEDKRETALLLEYPDDIIYIEEKIDGANFRFMLTDDGRIIFGIRTNVLGDDTSEIKGIWKKCVNFILSKLEGKDLSFYKGFIFYGECCTPHSIKYNWDSLPPFLGFDIMKDDKFLDFDEKRNVFAELGLPVVPAFPVLTADYIQNTILSENDIPISEYRDGLQAEGIVLKNYRAQKFVKFVSAKFKEVNKDTYGPRKEYVVDDNERLLVAYCTNPRIEKQIFKLVDEGNELDIKLMQFLPIKVWEDILEEHSKEILHKDWKLDIGACREAVSKRCFGVLEQVIQLQLYDR